MPMPGTDDIEFDMAGALEEMSSPYTSSDTTDGGVVDVEMKKIPENGDATLTATTPPASTTTQPAHPTDVPPPPKTWRPEAAAHWNSLTQEVRAEVLKREEDMFKGLEGYKHDATFGKSISSALTPYLPTMQQYGLDPVKQISGLMQAHHTLVTGTPEQKQALFAKLAADYGIQTGTSETPPYVDPEVSALRNDFRSIQSELAAQKAARREAEFAASTKQIEAFAADPKNLYFKDLSTDMGKLLEKGLAVNLQEAYEQAIWLNPAIRAKEVARQTAEAAAKAAEEAAAKVEAAKKATAANVRASAKPGGPTAPKGSMDDTLNETLRAIQSR